MSRPAPGPDALCQAGRLLHYGRVLTDLTAGGRLARPLLGLPGRYLPATSEGNAGSDG
jgi:hypothetical protein